MENRLVMPDADLAASVERCFLSMLRVHLPSLVVQVGTAATEPVKVAGPKRAYRGQASEPTPVRLLE